MNRQELEEKLQYWYLRLSKIYAQDLPQHSSFAGSTIARIQELYGDLFGETKELKTLSYPQRARIQ